MIRDLEKSRYTKVDMVDQAYAHRVKEAPLSGCRIPVALPPGALSLIGADRKGGLVWSAGYPHPAAAIVALIRRALSVPEEPA